MHDGIEAKLLNDRIVNKKRRKGIYILPNLFTLAALFGGFFSIVMAMDQKFDMAAVGIFFSMVFDSLDGRIARMTNTQSAFGEQMDSLSDMVSFGAAPSLIAYAWSLKELGRWGWFASFVYCACAALRLARFNVNTTIIDKRYFQGLPSPAAAALIASFIWLGIYFNLKSDQLAWPLFCVILYAGLTMVSNIPFYSFKDVQMRHSVPFVVIVLIAIIMGVAYISPEIFMFAIFLMYAMSGYVIYIIRKVRGHHVTVISTSTEEPEERGLHK